MLRENLFFTGGTTNFDTIKNPFRGNETGYIAFAFCHIIALLQPVSLLQALFSWCE